MFLFIDDDSFSKHLRREYSILIQGVQVDRRDL
jgi:hypothetical protein